MPTKTAEQGKKLTPAMRQFEAFKQRYPDCILFFRMGDFYEMFGEDAVTCSKALGITLTERSPGQPMAGVPHHSVESYLRRMIEQGYRVAICDQIQDPREAKGVVERAVTRVLTPGTLVDDEHLDGSRANHLACIAFLGMGHDPDDRVAIATVELSTGRFVVSGCAVRDALDELALRGVSELLVASTADGEIPDRAKRLIDALGVPATPRPGWHFRSSEALEAIRSHYQVASLGGFGLADDDEAIGAIGTILRYLRETQALSDDDSPSKPPAGATPTAIAMQRKSLAHLSAPIREQRTDHLRIDAASLRSLEIESTVRGGKVDGSLLGVFLGRTGPRTAMGKRLLREWLCSPLCDREKIEARQRCVSTLMEDRAVADELRESLSGLQDIARIAARVGLSRATPRDLVALGRSLGRIEPLTASLQGSDAFSAALGEIETLREKLEPIATDIASRCVDDPPAHLRDGGLFRDGVDEILDRARTVRAKANTFLAEYQKQLIDEHNLPSLKVGYNKVFGYYIELPAGQAKRAPDIFTRKQTLKNAERYITPELKQFEDEVLGAGEKAVARELDLFHEVCDRVIALAREIGAFAGVVAELDVLLCFADRAAARSWVRPTITDEPTLHIVQGRHPVLDEIAGDGFVPNDTSLGRVEESESDPPLALITGPNMAGKSTYIRQVALITLLAHTGSFVPADSATIGLTDRIFTRIGADDALHRGQSTFMVEMTETANILNNATPRSLIILDEIGRGTSTLDGLSLAWAITEYLASGDTPPRTLFATHYHELTDLAERLPGRVANFHVSVREWGDEIVFLHRILPGATNRSFGVHVGRLAGLPGAVIGRASDLLASLSVSHDSIGEKTTAAADSGKPATRTQRADPSGQFGLFTEFVPHPVIEEIKKLDLDRMSPLQAFETLRKFVAETRKE